MNDGSSKHSDTISGALIREALQSDLSSINAIYNHYVHNSTATFAEDDETEAARLTWFQKHEQSQHPILVLENEGAVIGWASLSAYHSRCAYANTVEVSIYFDNQKLGAGYGSKLFEAIIEAARDRGYHAVLGLVCSENIGSLKLMSRYGFAEVGRLKEVGFKFGRWLDVTIVEKIL
ncbi:MAG: GNAT family N-acetyltransferase [Candidatus Obscuribacterales bacterium]|nr:GNAT family N-acetyltransferase [Candidatus Obscuribacterales bacterium]